MKTRALAMSLLFALAATPALAQTSPPANAAAPGLLRIDVDARDLARRIFKVTATVPATPGPMTLLYPQWIPGEHGPQAHVEAGIDAMANGNYREASRHLEIAANEGIDAPPLAILRAIAAEGAGEPDLAARFVTGDTERILLRDVAKRAFMENADVAIAGPAYQLYLRLTPNDGRDANRAMMERAVEVWKSPPAPAAP